MLDISINGFYQGGKSCFEVIFFLKGNPLVLTPIWGAYRPADSPVVEGWGSIAGHG
jgi:hypothetical protein